VRFLKIIAVASILLAAAAAPAAATEPIESFSSSISTTQAGAHPDIETSFMLESPGSPEAARNAIFNAPEGIFGNPNAVPRCTSSDYAQQRCPSNTQVGLITVYAGYEGDPDHLLGTAPMYDLTPGPHTALLGFTVPILDIPINIPVNVRTGGDYGLRFTVSNMTQLTPLAGAHLTFWGFPADEVHDVERFAKGSPGNPAGCPGLADASCVGLPAKAGIAVHPFTDNPTTCPGNSLPVRLAVETYQDPGHFSHADGSYPPITECEKEVFKPVLTVKTTTNEADSASGLDITLNDPQFLGFAASPSELQAATVVLPPGLTINPDAADGQTACTDSEARFGSEEPAECPDNAKIGTVGIHSVALDGTLEGSIYIGEPKPGNQYRFFMTVDGFGIHAKLIGTFRPDPATGQVTAYFEDLPQVPFDLIEVHLFASDRGLIATPTTCRLYEVHGVFYPWNKTLPQVNSNSNISIEAGPNGSTCPGALRPFSPRLAAGTSHSVAGAFTDFSLQLDRDDGDQFLGDLNFAMPPGLTGSLRGITYCPEASITAAARNPGRVEASAPSCPASSQIGTTNVAAGPGGHPFHAIGRMYMAGPFKGAPLSLVAVTPALAGPYDYGTQVVRVAIHVDPRDAHVVAISDTVPSIIGGVPIRLRSIRVNLNRPNFIINPTNCSNFAVNSQGIGDQGTVTDFSSYFHADNCSTLPFKPKLKVIQMGGRKATRRSHNPRLRFDLRTRIGDANIKSISVTLPKSFAIDQRHLGNICSRGQLAAEQCAGRQAIGTVSVRTPLLDAPLSGPAYAVSGFGKLPHVVFILNGQVAIMPEAESSSVRGGHLKTVVPIVPDAPVGLFRLDLFGGKHGYLVNTRSLCRSAAEVSIRYAAQNGASLTQHVKTGTACGGGKRAGQKH
jgi:hypothetical protein